METTTIMGKSQESIIPKAVSFVLDRNGLEVLGVDESDGGACEVEMTGYTPEGGQETHTLHLSDVEDIDEWKASFCQMVSLWDPQEKAMAWVVSLDLTPFDNVLSLCKDLIAYKREVLEAALGDLSLLSSFAFLEVAQA